MSKRRSWAGRILRELQHWAEFVITRAVAWIVGRLPLPWCRAIGARIGPWFFFAGETRRVALRNFAVAYPQQSLAQGEQLLNRAAHHAGWNLIDLLRSERWTDDELLERVAFEGLEHLEGALAQGAGALALLPHMGGFELAMRAAPLVGIPLAVVVRALHNQRLDVKLSFERSRTGCTLIPHRRALPQILRRLRAGQVIAILNDQYASRSHGVLAPFLGVQAWTSPGIAMAALRTGAPVVPCYVIRDGDDHQTLHFAPPLRLERSDDPRKDVVAATQRLNDWLSATIREHPEQWLWAHRRFRHSPDLEENPYRSAPTEAQTIEKRAAESPPPVPSLAPRSRG